MVRLLKVILLLTLIVGVAFGSQVDEDEFIPESTHTAKPAELDEDEFIGAPTPVEQPKETILKNLAKPVKPTDIPDFAPPRTDYYVEIGYGCVIVAYILNFFIGKRHNEGVAKAWAGEIINLARSQFSRVGDMRTGEVGIVKETQNVFHLNAAGRIHCQGMQATLKLRKRHDFLSTLQELLFPVEDQLVITFAMNADEVDPFVFVLLRKKDEKAYRKNNPDVGFTNAAQQVPGLPSSLAVCSEHEDLVNDLITSHKEVVQTLNKLEPLIISMHFSDQGLVSDKHKHTMQFVFRLPRVEDMQQLAVLTKMALYLVDVVATTKLSKQACAKSEKHRVRLQEAAQKELRQQQEEAAQQRKLEKRKKEKEALAKMSPEEQAKWEEKQYKRELKKKQSGRVKMVVG